MFLGVGILVPFAVFFWRYPLLKSAQHLDSMLSRESAFLVNNLLLLGVAFVTLWGTVYPLITKLAIGESITVARPFYDQVNGPLFLGLLILMGVGPLLPWRRATPSVARRSLWLPAAVGIVTVLVLFILGVHKPYPLVGFGISALVTTGILSEWFRGARSLHRSRGDIYPVAFLRLIWANRPRYGGYIVHLSVIMVALGVIGTSFYNTQQDLILAPGDTTTIQGYEIRYLGTQEDPKSNRVEFTSTVEVYRDGELLDTLFPKRTFYPSFNMAATQAAIRSTPIDDLYVVPSENLANGSVGFRILVNPLIWWMWVAGPVLVLGTLVSLWPSPVRETSRALVRSPQPAQSRPTPA
jgi:cytochrome c-type biogenesis protein CcmF